MTAIEDDFGPEARFRAFLRDGKPSVQRCPSCGATQFYPSVVCRSCGATALAWREISGNGSIYAFTEVSGDAPFTVALIDLDEGTRVLSSVAGSEARSIGTRVRARIEERNGIPILVFDVAR